MKEMILLARTMAVIKKNNPHCPTCGDVYGYPTGNHRMVECAAYNGILWEYERICRECKTIYLYQVDTNFRSRHAYPVVTILKPIPKP